MHVRYEPITLNLETPFRSAHGPGLGVTSRVAEPVREGD